MADLGQVTKQVLGLWQGRPAWKFLKQLRGVMEPARYSRLGRVKLPRHSISSGGGIMGGGASLKRIKPSNVLQVL